MRDRIGRHEDARKPMDAAELERMFALCETDLGRAQIVTSLVAASCAVPDKYVSRAIEIFEQKGRFKDAAHISEDTSNHWRAVEQFIRGGHFDLAFMTARDAGLEGYMHDIAGLAMSHYEKEGVVLHNEYPYETASDILETIVSMPGCSKESAERVVRIFHKNGNNYRAADVAEKVGLTGLLIEVLEESGRFREAADAAEKAGLTETAEGYRYIEQRLAEYAKDERSG